MKQCIVLEVIIKITSILFPPLRARIVGVELPLTHCAFGGSCKVQLELVPANTAEW